MTIDNFIIDPPWPRQKGGLRSSRPNQNKTLDYSTMSLTDIFQLLDKEIFIYASAVHNVFLWNIDKFLHDAEKAMIDREYKLHARFIWDKNNGVAPAFTVRYSHEYLCWFYKPKLLKIDNSQRGKFTTVFHEKAREHSRKPDCAYNMIELLYPNCNNMDVFSREKRKNWLQFGNQTEFFN